MRQDVASGELSSSSQTELTKTLFLWFRCEPRIDELIKMLNLNVEKREKENIKAILDQHSLKYYSFEKIKDLLNYKTNDTDLLTELFMSRKFDEFREHDDCEECEKYVGGCKYHQNEFIEFCEREFNKEELIKLVKESAKIDETSNMETFLKRLQQKTVYEEFRVHGKEALTIAAAKGYWSTVNLIGLYLEKAAAEKKNIETISKSELLNVLKDKAEKCDDERVVEKVLNVALKRFSDIDYRKVVCGAIRNFNWKVVSLLAKRLSKGQT